MPDKILVILEHRNGQIKKATFESARFASDLAGKLNSEAEGIIIGAEISGLDTIAGLGLTKITHIKNQSLDNYSSSAYAKIAAEFAKSSGSTIVVTSNTALGKDLAPRLAVKLDAGIIVDAVDIKIDNGEIILTRPVYAGKAFVDVKFNTSNKVITIRPNVFAPGESDGSNVEIEVRDVDDVDLSEKVTEIKRSKGKLDVAEADIIVSGGRGMKGPENFHLIEELAEVLGAATGASRAVVDAGWRPHSEQVGQTGKTVSPNLYIAVGISGAIQHLAGMRSSKYIVAINKDKEAPIFQVADYGIAGDAFEVLPRLIEELKQIKEN